MYMHGAHTYEYLYLISYIFFYSVSGGIKL